MTLDKKLTTPFTPGFKESLSKKQSPIQLFTTSNYWHQLVILTLCESQILPVSKKPTAHHKEEESEKLNFHFWGFWSQPGQPEKVEILSCESLFHEIWQGSLQPLAYPHLLYLVELKKFIWKPFLPSQLKVFPHIVWNLRDVNLIEEENMLNMTLWEPTKFNFDII